jgi:hypothetical protein
MQIAMKVFGYVLSGLLIVGAIALSVKILVPTAMWTYNYVATDTPSRHFSQAGATWNDKSENDGPELQDAGYRRNYEEHGRENRQHKSQSANKPCIVMCGQPGREVEIHRYLPNPPDNICFQLLAEGGDAQQRCNKFAYPHRRR